MKKSIAILGGVGICISFIIFMNNELIRYRSEELRYRLDIISQAQRDTKTLGLVSRYNIIKKRIAKGGDREEDYIKESKLQGILRSTNVPMSNVNSGSKMGEYDLLKSATKLYLRAIRFIIRKEMPEEVYRAYHDPFLDLSYFYMRSRRYREAISVMANIRKRRINLPGYTRRIILLHSGFCYALLSEYKAAKEYYTKIIKYYPGTDESHAAKELMGFLQTINREVNNLLTKTIPVEEKAEKLYLLSAYDQAKKLYDKYFAGSTAGVNKPARAKFYRARTTEELGEKDAAVKYYLEIIARAPGSKWAVMSNKRLLMLGSFYGGDVKLINIAKSNSKRLGDEEFIEKLQGLNEKLAKDKFKRKHVEKSYNDFLKSTEVIKVKEEDHINLNVNIVVPDVKSKNVDAFEEVIKKEIIEKVHKINTSEKRKVHIITIDGFTFDGELIDDNKNMIILKTEFGNIPIKKSIIKSIYRK